MNLLKFKDKKYFIKLLKSFSSKSQILFEITHDSFKISSLEAPYIYLTLPDNIFSIDTPIEFIINATELIKNIDILKSNFVILENSFKIVEIENEGFLNNDDFSFIDIPFNNPIETFYCHCYEFSTRFIIDKFLIRNFINGKVNYQNDNNLILKSVSNNCDEKMEIEVDYISKSFLNFTTYNNWMNLIMPFYDLIDTVLFEFTDDLMCIKFLLKEYINTFIEIQNRALNN